MDRRVSEQERDGICESGMGLKRVSSSALRYYQHTPNIIAYHGKRQKHIRCESVGFKPRFEFLGFERADTAAEGLVAVFRKRIPGHE